MNGLRRYIKDYNPQTVPPSGTKIMPEIASGLIDFHKSGSRILEAKDPFVYPLANQIKIKPGTVFSLLNGVWRTFEIYEEIILGVGDLVAGSAFKVGTDYYVYHIDDGGNGTFVIAEDTTFPPGESSDNTRKMGGFHFGHVRCVNERWTPISPSGTSFGADGIGWKKNVVVGIVPNSVWDISDRPPMPGMASVGNTWRFIYPASQEESIAFENGANGLFTATGKLQSKYGQLPVTGTEGMNWFTFAELAGKQGLRLPTYAEFVIGAYGNPGGQDDADEYGWTKTSNTARTRTGCNVDGSTGQYIPSGGIKPYAVSAYNLVDCVGNVSEWVDELSTRPDGTWTWAWRNVLGADKGQAYLQSDGGLAVYRCGGYWGHGVIAGSRAVDLNSSTWYLRTDAGVRLACDKLVT